MNTLQHFAFTFRLSKLPYFPVELQRKLSNITFEWSNLRLQAVGEYNELVALHTVLANAIGGENVTVDSIKLWNPENECGELPRASKLNELCQKHKEVLVSNVMALNIAAQIIGGLTGRNSNDTLYEIGLIVAEKLNKVSDDQVNQVAEDMTIGFEYASRRGVFVTVLDLSDVPN